MKIIDFEKAKARKYSKDKIIKSFSDGDNDESELQKQYRELAQFYEHWYDEHVVGQDENGRWLYK